MNEINAAFIRSILDYNPETGVFTWRERADMSVQWNGRYAGTKAGSHTGNGYWRVGIYDRDYLAHRLAWLWMTGAWPKNQIDHRDTNRGNNRWFNLREATNAENVRNRGAASNNKIGHKGVSWNRCCKKWLSQIVAYGKHYHLGYFDDIEDAAAAYEVAARELHGKFARAA